MAAPTGQYYPNRLINLGTNRWAFKPEVALSYPIAQRWLVDVYAALWLFGANGSFYPGTERRTQELIGALQAHVGYSLSVKAWAAFDATWYAGGQTAVDGVPKGASRVELARRRATGLSGRQQARPSRSQAARARSPVRGRLRQRLGGMADGLGKSAARETVNNSARLAFRPRWSDAETGPRTSHKRTSHRTATGRSRTSRS